MLDYYSFIPKKVLAQGCPTHQISRRHMINKIPGSRLDPEIIQKAMEENNKMNKLIVTLTIVISLALILPCIPSAIFIMEEQYINLAILWAIITILVVGLFIWYGVFVKNGTKNLNLAILLVSLGFDGLTKEEIIERLPTSVDMKLIDFHNKLSINWLLIFIVVSTLFFSSLGQAYILTYLLGENAFTNLIFILYLVCAFLMWIEVDSNKVEAYRVASGYYYNEDDVKESDLYSYRKKYDKVVSGSHLNIRDALSDCSLSLTGCFILGVVSMFNFITAFIFF